MMTARNRGGAIAEVVAVLKTSPMIQGLLAAGVLVDDAEEFPERLRGAREKRQLSQGDLAVRAGLQASAISHFETGDRKPSFDNLRRLADALEVTADYLLGRITAEDGLAGADTMYRDRLSSDDRGAVEQLVKHLADKGRMLSQTIAGIQRDMVHRSVLADFAAALLDVLDEFSNSASVAASPACQRHADVIAHARRLMGER